MTVAEVALHAGRPLRRRSFSQKPTICASFSSQGHLREQLEERSSAAAGRLVREPRTGQRADLGHELLPLNVSYGAA